MTQHPAPLTRRAALFGLLAMPAIVQMPSLMRLPPHRLTLWGDGIHDDTGAAQAVLDGRTVRDTNGLPLAPGRLDGRSLLISKTLQLSSGNVVDNCKVIYAAGMPIFNAYPGIKNVLIQGGVFVTKKDQDFADLYSSRFQDQSENYYSLSFKSSDPAKFCNQLPARL